MYVEARADVLGLALQVGQVMFDFHLPSFRFAWTPGSPWNSGWAVDDIIIMHWYGGVSVSYIF